MNEGEDHTQMRAHDKADKEGSQQGGTQDTVKVQTQTSVHVHKHAAADVVDTAEIAAGKATTLMMGFKDAANVLNAAGKFASSK